MMPTLIIIEIAVASAVTTMDVRASDVARLRPAISPAAPGMRRRIPRSKRIVPLTNAGEIIAAAATANKVAM